jgi:hypothetical protein
MESDEIDKQIELKKLEIEKLKLEKEAFGYGAIKTEHIITEEKQEAFASSNSQTAKYPNFIAYNVIILLGACVTFYLLPWGELQSSVTTNFGNANYVGSQFTGFNLGLFTYSYPITIINIILAIVIIGNNLKYVWVIATVGFLGSLIAVFNGSQFNSLHANISNQFGSMSAGSTETGWAFLLPFTYALLILLNSTQKKSLQGSVSDGVIVTPPPIIYYTINDLYPVLKLGSINFFVSTLIFISSICFAFVSGIDTSGLLICGTFLGFFCNIFIFYPQKSKLSSNVTNRVKTSYREGYIFYLFINGIMYLVVLSLLFQWSYSYHNISALGNIILIFILIFYSIDIMAGWNLLLTLKFKEVKDESTI